MAGFEQLVTARASAVGIGTGRGCGARRSVAGRMPALAAPLDLVTLLLAVFATVLAPFAALLNGAFAGRMGALRRICHRVPPDRSLYAPFRPPAFRTRPLYRIAAVGTIRRLCHTSD